MTTPRDTITASEAVQNVQVIKPSLEDEKPRLGQTSGDCGVFQAMLDKLLNHLPWFITGMLIGIFYALLVIELKSQP